MAYAPINWKTGDVVTAEKMNKMDNGWSVENTQLFSESITTVEDQGDYFGSFAYNQLIDSDVIKVTFNGTDYVCDRTSQGDFNYYGAPYGDFSAYPFLIVSRSNSGTVSNDIITEAAGTYTVAIETINTEVSASFANAVAMASSEPDFEIIPGTTTWAEADAALRQGKNVYFYVGSSTSQKSVILLSSVTDAYRLCGVSIASFSDSAPYITVLTAETEDGVLS